MVKELLVTRQIEESRNLLRHLNSKGLLVAHSFWANNDEDDRWRLIIASSKVDSDGVLPWYRVVLKIFGELRISAFSPSDVILMEVHNVMVDDIVSNTIHASPTESGYSKYGSFLVYHLADNSDGSRRITFSDSPTVLTTTTASPIIYSGLSSIHIQGK